MHSKVINTYRKKKTKRVIMHESNLHVFLLTVAERRFIYFAMNYPPDVRRYTLGASVMS